MVVVIGEDSRLSAALLRRRPRPTAWSTIVSVFLRVGLGVGSRRDVELARCLPVAAAFCTKHKLMA
jgi:hypothetical protein